MKYLNWFLSSVAAVLMTAGCIKEVDQALHGNDYSVTFTAEIGESSTKTVLDEWRKLSLWYGEEAISIFNGGESHLRFIAHAPEKTTVVSFLQDDGEPFVHSGEVVAVYPYSASSTFDKESLTVSDVSVPSVQKPTSWTYDSNASILMARTTDMDLRFKNAVSLIRFNVRHHGVKNVTITANGGEPMAGRMDLAWNDGSPVLRPSVNVSELEEGGSSDCVSLFNGDDVEGGFIAGNTYYAAVVPGEYSAGFTVTIDGQVCRVTEEAMTLERNTIYDLGYLKIQGMDKWGICGSMTDWGSGPDLVLTESGDWLVYEGLAVSFRDCFLFRADNLAGEEYGCDQIAASSEICALKCGPATGNIYLWEPAIYDIYLAKDLTSFMVIKVGDIPGKPEHRNWGVVGTMNDWGGSGPDQAMTVEGNLYVARNVAIDRDADRFKFRVDQDWRLGDLGGSSSDIRVFSATPYSLRNGGSDIYVEESGVYDIFLSAYEDGFRVMKVRDLPTEAEKSSWYMTGTFNEWNPADDDYRMTIDGDWSVYWGLNLSEDAEMKFAEGGWDNSRGGKWVGVNEAVELVDEEGSGSNIHVPSGTYDVYLNSEANIAYFCSPGRRP